MASMHARIEYMDKTIEREVVHYRERARGSVALTITSGIGILLADGIIE